MSTLIYLLLIIAAVLWFVSRVKAARARVTDLAPAAVPDRPLVLTPAFPPAETVTFDALTFAGLKARKWNVATSIDPQGRTHHVIAVPGHGRCVYRIVGPDLFGADDRAVYRGHRIA